MFAGVCRGRSVIRMARLGVSSALGCGAMGVNSVLVTDFFR